jgi:hypothetical protein
VKARPNVTNHEYEYSWSKKLGLATAPPGVTAAWMNPGSTGAMATTSAITARGFTPRV